MLGTIFSHDLPSTELLWQQDSVCRIESKYRRVPILMLAKKDDA